MNILNIISKISKLCKNYQHGIFIGFCLLITAGIGYNLGRIWVAHNPVMAEAGEANIQDASRGSKSAQKGSRTQTKPTIAATPIDPRVVVSKASSSRLYHHIWCSGAKRIKESNKRWFPTDTEAIAAGYTLAANCQ